GRVLPHQRFLRVELLLGDGVLGPELAIPLQVDLRVGEQGLVLGELPLRLGELDLEGPRIDLGQEVTRAHHLPFLEVDGHQLAVDPAAHRDRGERRDGTEAVQVDADVAAARRLRHDRDGTSGARRSMPARRRSPRRGPPDVAAGCGASPAAVPPLGDQKRYAPTANTTAAISTKIQRRLGFAAAGGWSNRFSVMRVLPFLRVLPFRCSPVRGWLPARTA